jgi:hypothetical protein
MIWNDPIVEEIRKIRESHAAKFHFDVIAIGRDLQERQRASRREYVSPPQRPESPSVSCR